MSKELHRMQGSTGSFLNLYPKSAYDPTEYERAGVTVDIAVCRVHENNLQVLLVNRSENPFKNKWAIPGGFVSIAKMEDIDHTAVRVLNEKTGISDVPVYQLKAYGESNRDPRWRMITITYYTMMPMGKIGNEVEGEWFNVTNLPKLAFDHNTIISDLVDDLKHRIVIEPIAFSLVWETFTWSHLQEVYEAVLQHPLIAPNFRRKINADYIIEQTSEKFSDGKGRPSSLLKYMGTKTVF